MPIHLKCPNGHHLTAKESNAGKTGKCPVCKASVTIPVLHQTAMTDSAIVRILGVPDAPKQNPAGVVGQTVAPTAGNAVGRKAGQAKAQGESPSHSTMTLPNVKQCPSCEREIDLGYHICPHCRTYITDLNDF